MKLLLSASLLLLSINARVVNGATIRGALSKEEQNKEQQLTRKFEHRDLSAQGKLSATSSYQVTLRSRILRIATNTS